MSNEVSQEEYLIRNYSTRFWNIFYLCHILLFCLTSFICRRIMLLNISSLDFWESRNVVSVEAFFVFKHYFCLYTPHVDLGSVAVASSLAPGPCTFSKGCVRHTSWERCSYQWLLSNGSQIWSLWEARGESKRKWTVTKPNILLLVA